MSEMTEAELRDLQERWEVIKSAMDIAMDAMTITWNAATEILEPVFEAIKQLVLYFAEMVQRAYLYQLLPQWIPIPVRSWLARHWPRALLPDLTEAIGWMKAEATSPKAQGNG